MPNTVTLSIKSDQGFHKVFLQQDANVPRTIHALIDDVAHPITDCSATSDGTSLQGNTVIRVFIASFKDVAALTVDPVANAITMTVSGSKINFSGIIGAAQAAALVAFVKKCALPSLADS